MAKHWNIVKGMLHSVTSVIARVVLVLMIASVVVVTLTDDTAAQRRKCVDCHEDFKDHIDKKFVHDPVKEGCDTCHKRHGFRQVLILSKGLPDLCTDCHEGVKHEIEEGTVHGALSQGGCTICHEPHASDQPALMRPAEEGGSLCTICHTNLTHLFANENAHEPFAKGECAACHQPHSSDRPFLLADTEDVVCGSCHEGVADKHKVMGLEDFGCSDCHDPHVASKDMLLASVSHPPFAEGDCESCHDIADGEVDIGDDFPPAELCADCHDDITEMLSGVESHFGADALAGGGTATCLECHDPHRSGLAKMLVKSENDLCRGCHESLPTMGSVSGPIHKPFFEGQCSACHAPHGGGGDVHLAQDGNALCASCHEGIAQAAGDGEIMHAAMEDLDCVDCHSGHASDIPSLLVDTPKETCEACHDKTQHRIMHPPYLTSTCLDCHRNHSRLPSHLAADVKTTCGRCHVAQIRLVDAPHPHDPMQEEDCLLCHAPHGSEFDGLLVQQQGEVCGECHDTEDLVVTSPAAPDAPAELHTPVKNGSCEGCHNPHGSQLASLLNREGDKLCYGCHTQEKVTFAAGIVHKPVADGDCAKCHTPHGSAFGNLNVMGEPGLCTQCHDFEQTGLAEAHKGFDLSDAKCSSCHTPHSSPSPNLLSPFVHDPFDEGDCEACHDGPVPEGRPNAIATASVEACVMCHDEKEEETGHQHATDVACVDCHEPHASKYESLLQNPQRLCKGCHTDILHGGGDGQVVLHKPLEEGNCLNCHQMHTPVGDKYLAMSQLDLCSDCHESVKIRTADANQHPPFGKGECSKCHETHASTQPHLLVESDNGLCRDCHDIAAAKMKTAHTRVPLRGEACASCHDPHSTPRKGGALIYANLHSPYEDGDCDVCHEAGGEPAQSVVICADCHDTDNDFETVHKGGRSGAESSHISICMDCHSPHAGYDALLVRKSQSETCLQCHDRAEFTRSVVHGALDEGCTACHNPHDSNIAELRGIEIDQKCISCHEEAKQHAHPIGTDYQDPRNGNPMTCLACHNPHSTDHERLTTFDHQRDLCVQCHASGTQRAH